MVTIAWIVCFYILALRTVAQSKYLPNIWYVGGRRDGRKWGREEPERKTGWLGERREEMERNTDFERIAILLLYPTLQLYSKCKELGTVKGKTQRFLCIRDGCWYLEERILDQFNTFPLLILWFKLTQMSLHSHQSAYLPRLPELNTLKGNGCGSVIEPLRYAELGGRHPYPWVTSCH